MSLLICIGLFASYAAGTSCTDVKACRECVGCTIADLWGGRVTDDQFNSAFLYTGFSSITDVLLYSNNLNSPESGVFNNMGNVTNLKLNANMFQTLPADFLIALPKLQTLSLDNNGLTSLNKTMFASNPLLTELYLNNNNLTSLPMGLFAGLSKLKTLRLENNPHMRNIPENIFLPLTSLQALTIHNCPNLKLPMDLGLASTSLRTLTLRGDSTPRYSVEIGTWASIKTLINLELFIDGEATYPDSCINLAPAPAPASVPTKYPTWNLDLSQIEPLATRLCDMPSNGTTVCRADQTSDRNITGRCETFIDNSNGATFIKGVAVVIPVDYYCTKAIADITMTDIRGASPVCFSVTRSPTGAPTMTPTTQAPTGNYTEPTEEVTSKPKSAGSCTGPSILVVALVAGVARFL